MLAYNERDGIVTVDGRDIPPTPRQNDIVSLLWQERPHYVSTHKLEAKLFGSAISTENIKVYVRRMRGRGVPIESRPWWGYRLAASPEGPG